MTKYTGQQLSLAEMQAAHTVRPPASATHLADRKEPFDHVLHALVNLALVQDGAEALKHAVQALGGHILQVAVLSVV